MESFAHLDDPEVLEHVALNFFKAQEHLVPTILVNQAIYSGTTGLLVQDLRRFTNNSKPICKSLAYDVLATKSKENNTCVSVVSADDDNQLKELLNRALGCEPSADWSSSAFNGYFFLHDLLGASKNGARLFLSQPIPDLNELAKVCMNPQFKSSLGFIKQWFANYSTESGIIDIKLDANRLINFRAHLGSAAFQNYQNANRAIECMSVTDKRRAISKIKEHLDTWIAEQQLDIRRRPLGYFVATQLCKISGLGSVPTAIDKLLGASLGQKDLTITVDPAGEYFGQIEDIIYES